MFDRRTLLAAAAASSMLGAVRASARAAVSAAPDSEGARLTAIYERIYDMLLDQDMVIDGGVTSNNLYAQLLLGLSSIFISAGHMDGGQMIKLGEWAQHIVTFRWGAANFITDVHWIYKAHVFLGLSTHGKGESTKITAKFNKQQFKAIDLTHDELAKEHIRHMVGGHSALSQDERLLRFEFPERPGALLKFLSLMRPGWNISLFHYRNQGADYGRILVGLQVPAKDDKAFADSPSARLHWFYQRTPFHDVNAFVYPVGAVY